MLHDKKVMLETGIILTVVITAIFTLFIPKYGKTEKNIRIEATGDKNENALSDGIQIMRIMVDGEQQDLSELLGNPEWSYENGTYTWADFLECSKFVEFSAGFRQMEIVFLKNRWCGEANIYVGNELSDTLDFYSDQETTYAWKINGSRQFTHRVWVCCALILIIWCICVGQTVRKLKLRQGQTSDIVLAKNDNNKVMWSENFKVEFSDSLGSVSDKTISGTHDKQQAGLLTQARHGELPAGRPRQAWIDVLKGMGMMMVIAGHGDDSNSFAIKSAVVSTMIWAVHMPLFFIVSGYTFRVKTTSERIKRDAKILLLPYFGGVLAMFFANALYNHFCRIPFKTGVLLFDYLKRGLYGSGGCALSLFHDKIHIDGIGAIWFFCAMFMARLFLNELLKLDERYQFPAVLCLAYSGVMITDMLTKTREIYLPWSVQTGMTATVFLYAGYIMAREGWWWENWLAKSICILISAVTCVCGSGVAMYRNEYPSGVMNFIAAICMTACIAQAARWIEGHSRILKAVLEYLGKESAVILIFHLVELEFVPWGKIYGFLFGDNLTSAGRWMVTLLLKLLWGVLFVWIIGKAESCIRHSNLPHRLWHVRTRKR